MSGSQIKRLKRWLESEIDPNYTQDMLKQAIEMYTALPVGEKRKLLKGF